MEVEHFTSPPFFISCLLIIFLFIVTKQSKKSKKLPPSPFKLPLIGHLHYLIGRLPHHSLNDLSKKYGPLMYLELGKVPVVVISSSNLAKQMMTTHDLIFINRPRSIAAEIISYGYAGLPFAPYGDHWKQLRKICMSELLNAKHVRSFWPLREEALSELITKISLSAGAGSPINLSKEILNTINDIIAKAAFGKKCEDKEEWLTEIKAITELFSSISIDDVFPSLKFVQIISGKKRKLEKAHQKTDNVLERIITEHKAKRVNHTDGEDFVDVLLRLQESGELTSPFTKEMLKSLTWDIFGGATDTVVAALEWSFSELMRSPRVMEKAQGEVRQVFSGKRKISQEDLKELKYLGQVIKETLRLHPPAPLLLPRECGETCEMEGLEIRKGCKVIVNAWAIGRDPKHWRNPDCFQPERFQGLSIGYTGTDFNFLPFGAGRRMCPGALFGIANMEIVLAMLLYHFDWKLDNCVNPEELDMTEKVGIIAGRKNNLLLVPTAHILLST